MAEAAEIPVLEHVVTSVEERENVKRGSTTIATDIPFVENVCEEWPEHADTQRVGNHIKRRLHYAHKISSHLSSTRPYGRLAVLIRGVNYILKEVTDAIADIHQLIRLVLRAQGVAHQCLFTMQQYSLEGFWSHSHDAIHFAACRRDITEISLHLSWLHNALVKGSMKVSGIHSVVVSRIFSIKARSHVAYQHIATCCKYHTSVEQHPIHQAAFSKTLFKVLLHYFRESDCKKRNHYYSSVVHVAVFGKNVQVLNGVLSLGANVNHVNGLRQTPLMVAALLDEEALVGDLLRKGADPNLQDVYKQTPLHVAVSRENVVMVKVLVTYGASVSLMDSFGDTPLSLSSESIKACIYEVIAKNKFKSSVLNKDKWGVNRNIGSMKRKLSGFLIKRFVPKLHI